MRKLGHQVRLGFFCLTFLFWLGVMPQAHARQGGDFGFTLSALTDPYPGFAGANLLYHLDPHWRIQVGASTMIFGGSVGAGVRYIVSPEPGLSPVFGVSWTSASLIGFKEFFLFDFSAEPIRSQHYSAYVGLETATSGGFLFGVGLNAIFAQIPADSVGAAVMPGLYLGWLF